MGSPTNTASSRQVDRDRLRRRADRALKGLLGTSLSRSDRRVAVTAYAVAAYRKTQDLPALPRYYKGKVIVLNEALVKWIAFGDRPAKVVEQEIIYTKEPINDGTSSTGPDMASSAGA